MGSRGPHRLLWHRPGLGCQASVTITSPSAAWAGSPWGVWGGGAPLWPPELHGGALLCLLGDAFDSPPAASPSLVHSLLEDLGHVVSGQERGRFSHVHTTSRSTLLLCSPDSWERCTPLNGKGSRSFCLIPSLSTLICICWYFLVF